jgi:hypothetical protein
MEYNSKAKEYKTRIQKDDVKQKRKDLGLYKKVSRPTTKKNGGDRLKNAKWASNTREKERRRERGSTNCVFGMF